MRKWSVAVMVLTVFIWTVYDVVMSVNDTPGDTFSEILWDWTGNRAACFLISFGLGFLAGHVVFPLRIEHGDKKR